MRVKGVSRFYSRSQNTGGYRETYSEEERVRGLREVRKTHRRQKTVFQTPEFLALRKEWYEKLKESGFKDIENIRWKDGESMECLNGMSQMDLCRGYTPEQQRYFELAKQWYWTLMTDRRSWEEYVHGRWRKRWQGRHPCVEDQPYSLAKVRKVWGLWSEGVTMRGIERRARIPRPIVSEIIRYQESLMLKNACGLEYHHSAEVSEDSDEPLNHPGVGLLEEDSEGWEGGAVLEVAELEPALEEADG